MGPKAEWWEGPSPDLAATASWRSSPMPAKPSSAYPAPEAHRLSLAAFTNAVLSGEEPNASGLDGLRSAQVCEAIERSARERRLVEVVY